MHVCLILGAGASLANAQHFRPERMLDTHPPLDVTFFATLRARKIQLTPALRSYVRALTGRDPRPEVMDQIRMEDFFKDLYFDFQESPRDDELRSAYTDLIDLYARSIRETTNWLSDDQRKGAPVGRLLAAAGNRAEQLTIITFNHDLVIENELRRRGRLNSRWCLDQGYGSFSTELNSMGTSAPSFGPHGADCNHDAPITILKLHGSLNWFVRMRASRPTARMLSGQGGPWDILLSRRRRLRQRATARRGAGRGRTSWYLWPVIIPPVYAKQTLRRVVQPAWDDALAALRDADRVVFFGYSLPQLDVDAEKLFERGVSGNPKLGWMDIVNPAPDSAARYAALAPSIPVRWYPDLGRFLDEQPFT